MKRRGFNFKWQLIINIIAKYTLPLRTELVTTHVLFICYVRSEVCARLFSYCYCLQHKDQMWMQMTFHTFYLCNSDSCAVCNRNQSYYYRISKAVLYWPSQSLRKKTKQKKTIGAMLCYPQFIGYDVLIFSYVRFFVTFSYIFVPFF